MTMQTASATIEEARDFLKDLDVASDSALQRMKELVEMKIPKKHKNAHRLYMVQVEAAKLIIVTKLKTSGLAPNDDDALARLFDSFKLEYKKTELVLTKRPEALPAGRVLEHHDASAS